MPPTSPTSSAIIGAVAAFVGATGLLAGLGFLVQQSLFALLGAPTPPFATIDYLRVAGYFLFDLIVVVMLLYGVVWGVIPVLGLWMAFTLVIALWRPRVRTRAQFKTRYAHAWRWITGRWHQWFEGRVGLVTCLLLLVVFTFAYHYPVFAQRGLVVGAGAARSDSGCPTPAAVDSLWQPLRFGWDLVETRCASVRRLLPEKNALGETQSIYAQGALFLLVLTLYVVAHPYNQLTASGRGQSRGRRWLWSANAVLVAVSLAYLPSGYGVLFRDKQAPQVRFEFREESSISAEWRTGILFRAWYLLFQNEKEVWLYQRPDVVVLQKEQLAGLEILQQHWIFE